MTTYEEIQKKYESAIKYLEMAFDFRNHTQRSWTDDATLGRWFLGGAREVVAKFNTNIGCYEHCPSEKQAEEFMNKINTLVSKVRNFKNLLIKTFPEDTNIPKNIFE